MAKRKLTDVQKEQIKQKKEIRNLLKNIGFIRIPRINGKEFVYKDRTSEIDDIFYFENVVLITEYTVKKKKIGDHLLPKNNFYEKVNENKTEFLEFLLTNEKFKTFKEKYDIDISPKYSKNHIQLLIMYCSRYPLAEEHKTVVNNVIFFDYPIVKYFEGIAKVIKKSCRYEFFDFLSLPISNIGENILSSSVTPGSGTFIGQILPEEHSSFSEGYKIVSFYIDASSLLKRAYVLRRNDWRIKDNIGHYQRMFKSTKIRSMRKYLNDKNRVFVNNIVTTLSVEKIKLFDQDGNQLHVDDAGNIINSSETRVTPAKIEISDEANIVGIIDGQHRTFAYYEGDDIYESEISKLRNIQNLLVTGILFPKNEKIDKKLDFEANLFLEINATQTGASSTLKQEIAVMIKPFSTIAIAKRVLNKLNESGPLANKFEDYWFEQNKLKTATIVSYALRPLLKLDDKQGNDSLFRIWGNAQKHELKKKNCEEFDLLDEYITFSVTIIRKLLIAFKNKLDSEKWNVDRKDKNSILTITVINGMLNTLRLLIQNNQVSDTDSYEKKLTNIDTFDFKSYKTSHYRKMGQDIYDQFFK